MTSLEKKMAMLRLAEKNFKETHADCYAIERVRLQKEISVLQAQADVDVAPVPPTAEDAERLEKTPTDAAFVVPSNVEQLKDAMAAHLLATIGREALSNMSDGEIAYEYTVMLDAARAYYYEMNDTDALLQVNAMRDEIQSKLNPEDGNAEQMPTESTLSASQEKKTSKTTTKTKKATTRRKTTKK